MCDNCKTQSPSRNCLQDSLSLIRPDNSLFISL